MSKPKQPSANAQPPVTLAIPSPLSINFDPNASVKVTVAPPEKTKTTLSLQLTALLVVSAFLAVLWFSLFYTHVIERHYSPWPIQLGGTPLTVTMAYPARSAFGDDNDLDLIVTNSGSASFTGNIVVAMTGAHFLPNEPGAVEIKNLNSNESKTYRVKFTPLPKAGLYSGGIIGTALQTYAGDRLLSVVTADSLPIARWSYARTLLLWLRNSALVGAVALLLNAGSY
ncbi:MAG: hypothetical protein JST85_27890 [Acidobacteria bacterium]|nr:hypothetical protein [Acidobacteriota bacterium]